MLAGSALACLQFVAGWNALDEEDPLARERAGGAAVAFLAPKAVMRRVSGRVECCLCVLQTSWLVGLVCVGAQVCSRRHIGCAAVGYVTEPASQLCCSDS